MNILGLNNWKKYWGKRRIDWEKEYFTPEHPHRLRILNALRGIRFKTAFELGCGAGANLYLIENYFKGSQVGGYDLNRDAIAFAKTKLKPSAVLEVGGTKEVFLSSRGTDVALTDMCLFYLNKKDFRKTLLEMRRIADKMLIFSELHSTNPFTRLYYWLTDGYHIHNYQKELGRMGFYDISIQKMPPEDWPPGGEPQRSCAYLITAKP